MVRKDKLLADLIEFSDGLAKEVHFIDSSDVHIFNALKSFYLYGYEQTGNGGHLLKLCSLMKKYYRRYTPEVIDIAWKAVCSGGHPDSAVYYGMSVVNNFPDDLALAEIKKAYSVLENQDSINILKIFEAVVSWKRGDFSSYVDGLVDFLAKKREGFNPYISVPVSTVWFGAGRPATDCVLKLPGLGCLKTQLPNFNPSYIISISCDSRYYSHYSDYLFESLSKIEDGFYCHVSVVDAVDSKIDSNSISVVNQNLNLKENIGPVSSGLRFIHAFELLDKVRVPVVVMDFDVILKNGFDKLINNNRGKDICLRVLRDVLPWEKITAGFGIYYPTSKSLEFLSVVRDFLFNTLRGDAAQWWVDQNALECASRFVNPICIENIMPILHEYLLIPTGSIDSKRQQMLKVLGA